MKDQRKTEIKVGVTVTVAILLLIWVIGWAKNFSLNPERQIVKVKFSTVSGLEVADVVTVNGVRKGFVQDIIVNRNSAFAILSFDKDVDLRDDATFAISMLDLMGGKKVEVENGVAKAKLDLTKTHEGEFIADIPLVMKIVGSFRDDVQSLLLKIDVTLSSINKYLVDEDFNNQLRSALSNLAQVSQQLNGMIVENRSAFKSLVGNTSELANETKKFLEQNKDDISSMIGKTEKLMVSSSELITKIDKIISDTESKKNNLGKILYDETLMNDLKATIQSVKELTDILNAQLKGEGVNVDAKIDLF